MRIFKGKWFDRFARKEGIGDDVLKSIAADLEKGVYEGALGGNVYKKRIARPGGGKRGGYRTIIYFRSGERTFFVYAYAKSARANIDDAELAFFKEDAADDFMMSDNEINDFVKQGIFVEIVEPETKL